MHGSARLCTAQCSLSLSLSRAQARGQVERAEAEAFEAEGVVGYIRYDLDPVTQVCTRPLHPVFTLGLFIRISHMYDPKHYAEVFDSPGLYTVVSPDCFRTQDTAGAAGRSMRGMRHARARVARATRGRGAVGGRRLQRLGLRTPVGWCHAGWADGRYTKV